MFLARIHPGRYSMTVLRTLHRMVRSQCFHIKVQFSGTARIQTSAGRLSAGNFESWDRQTATFAALRPKQHASTESQNRNRVSVREPASLPLSESKQDSGAVVTPTVAALFGPGTQLVSGGGSALCLCPTCQQR